MQTENNKPTEHILVYKSKKRARYSKLQQKKASLSI